MNPVKKAVVSAISWYSVHSPILAGKSKLQTLGLKIINSPTITARSRDGDLFALHFPEDRGWEFLFFGHTYETGTIDLLKKILRHDDVVFDIGANIGWYTVNMVRCIPNGICHSFEPMPPTMRRLKHNCSLNQVDDHVIFNELALGETSGEVTLYSFDALGHGHNSLSTRGRSDYTTWTVPLVTLDTYVTERNVDRVDLVKMDVEGAEMGVLAGASRLFSLESPPVWIIEMNMETAGGFGHAPHELLDFISSKGNYTFFRIERGWESVIRMRDTHDYHHGDNAVCVPESRIAHWRRTVGME